MPPPATKYQEYGHTWCWTKKWNVYEYKIIRSQGDLVQNFWILTIYN